MDELASADVPQATTTKSVVQSCPILSLPKEIRLQIWEDLLQRPSEAMARLYHGTVPDGVFTRYFKERFSSLDTNGEDRVRPNILRVCRQVHEEATPIFYANMFVMRIRGGGRIGSEWLEGYEKMIRCFQRSRPVNVWKLFLIVYVGYGYHGNESQEILTPAHELRLHEACKAFSTVACYEKLCIQVLDQSEDKVLDHDIHLGLEALQSFGTLCCKEPKVNMVHEKTSAGLEWAMRRQGPTKPLMLLHQDLIYYLDNYSYDDPIDEFGAMDRTLKELFLARSESAVNDLDGDSFSTNQNEAIECVLDLVQQRARRISISRPEGYINARFWNKIAMEGAKEKGDRMKLARD